MNRVSVVLDTNLWISYLISKRLNRIEQLLYAEKVTLLFSEELLNEFLEVAHRPKFRRYFSEARVTELLNIFDYFGKVVEVTSRVEECRDVKDNFLLSLARDGKADYLVTGDDDLLNMRTFDATQIVSYRQFEQEVKL